MHAARDEQDEELAADLSERELVVVAALIKHAFGMALGTLGAIALAGVAVIGMLRGDGDPANTFAWLIGTLFPGFKPSAGGALLGVVWGFATGYAVGWGAALARNRIIKLHFWILNTRARLQATRDILDDLS